MLVLTCPHCEQEGNYYEPRLAPGTPGDVKFCVFCKKPFGLIETLNGWFGFPLFEVAEMKIVDKNKSVKV